MEFDQYLEYLGLSKAEFAREIGVTPDTVSRWRGEPPKIYMMWLSERRKRILFLQSLRRIQDAEVASILSEDLERRGEL